MDHARLHVTGSGEQRVVVLDQPSILIGRRTSADVQINATDVSREHAEIVQEDGRYLLRDKESRFGTFVNGEQIAEHELRDGDRIRLGRTDSVELVFSHDASQTTGFLKPTSDAGDLRQMAAIMDGLRALGSGRVLDEVLTLVLDSALEVTKAERGFVMLADEGRRLEFKVARGRGRVTLSGNTFRTSEKIPNEVFRTGKGRTVQDLLDDPQAGQHDGTIALGIRNVLCVPLRVTPMGSAPVSTAGERVIGVLYLDGREKATIMSPQTKASLEAFATQAALAIDSARLYAESAEKARIDRDLRIAAEIQQALLPEPVYENEVVELAAASMPCRTVAGDFFDYLDVGARGFGFALGDVAGKGPPAALLATAVQSNFVALAPISANPAEAMARVNKALLRRAVEARFATMFYGEVGSDGRLSYCNAGQEPPLVLHADGIDWLEEGGPVLGLLAIAVYESGAVALAAGDLVVVCSDGVTEARNPAGDEFGRDRVVESLRGLHGASPEAVLERLLAAVKEFSRGTPQGDDVTALVLRYRGHA